MEDVGSYETNVITKLSLTAFSPQLTVFFLAMYVSDKSGGA
jgi:hypothetical protein